MRKNVVYENEKPVSATVFHRGRIHVATPGHPNFDAIVEALESDRPAREVLDLYDTGSTIARGFRAAKRLLKAAVTQVSDMDLEPEDDGRPKKKQSSAKKKAEARKLEATVGAIEVRRGEVYYDGEKMEGAVVDAILAYSNAGHEDFLPLVRFLAKLMENPSEHSRRQLYKWMEHLSFDIHEDGDILAYKTVTKVGDHLRSNRAGPGYVNGTKEMHRQLRHDPGDVVSVDRDKVNIDPTAACGFGLHVGTVTFAIDTYGSPHVIECKVNPAHIISVPTDGYWQKVRASEYVVVREVTREQCRELRNNLSFGSAVKDG